VQVDARARSHHLEIVGLCMKFNNKRVALVTAWALNVITEKLEYPV
jgi:hypothetical protein